jgi:hypothetical protein
MNFRQLAYGLLSYLPWVPESLYKGTGGTDSAEYCYSIWLRHLVLAHSGGMQSLPRVVAELGPGDSIGVGLAALLSGTDRYLALDAVSHVDAAANLAIFDTLVRMFRERVAIPTRDVFPEHTLELASYAFPLGILGEARLQAALSPKRVARLRRIVSGETTDSQTIDYRAPWGDVRKEDAGTVDFLLSNAVMEHVADLPGAYRAMSCWLCQDGLASNQIDFRSHGLFSAWDGHWSCPRWLWHLFMGRRAYLLNREPFATHRALASAAGLEEEMAIRVEKASEAKRVASEFCSMSPQDRTTCGAYVLLRKPDDG